MNTHKVISLINDNYLFINQNGMYILGFWAVCNIISGLWYFKAKTYWKYFFLMNFYWNIINLLLAIYTFYDISNNQNLLNAYEIINQHHFIQKIFLLNVGLDVAYFAFGLFLRGKSKNIQNNELQDDRLLGFGNSLLIQGTFLFVFDIMMAVLHQIHNAKNIKTFFEITGSL